MQRLNNSSISHQKILIQWGVFFSYLFINGLFVVKYCGNFSYYLLPAYLISIFLVSILYIKVNRINTFYKNLFWILVAIFFIFTIGVNHFVEGNSLKVDRWDAMEIGIKAVFNGEYPYDIKNYLGRESSNLPFLIILGMPFYVVFGSVGFLQCFSFLLYSYLIFKIFDNYKLRVAAIVLLILSPSYLWEIYTKSDLLSNFILVLGFSYLIWTQIINGKKLKIEWISLMTALVFLTRLSVLIPIIVILFKRFCKFSIKEKLRFILVFIFTFSVLIFLFFLNAPSWEVIINHNPFTIQGGKQPVLLSVFYILIAIFFSFKSNSFFATTLFSGLLLFITVFNSYILHIVDYGYENVMVHSYFDLSFFNMSMPFIIVSLIFILKWNFKIDQK